MITSAVHLQVRFICCQHRHLLEDYISNNLGPYLNQPYSTNAVPSALVQLTSSGKINIDQIPALRPVQHYICSIYKRSVLLLKMPMLVTLLLKRRATTFNVAPCLRQYLSRYYYDYLVMVLSTGDQFSIYESGSTGAIQGIS